MYSCKVTALFVLAAAAAPALAAPTPQYGSSIIARDDTSLFAREYFDALVARAGEDESGASIIQSVIDYAVKALGIQLHRRDVEEILARVVDDELLARDIDSIARRQGPVRATPATKAGPPVNKSTARPAPPLPRPKRMMASPMFLTRPTRAHPPALFQMARSMDELD